MRWNFGKGRWVCMKLQYGGGNLPSSDRMQVCCANGLCGQRFCAVRRVGTASRCSFSKKIFPLFCLDLVRPGATWSDLMRLESHQGCRSLRLNLLSKFICTTIWHGISHNTREFLRTLLTGRTTSRTQCSIRADRGSATRSGQSSQFAHELTCNGSDAVALRLTEPRSRGVTSAASSSQTHP